MTWLWIVVALFAILVFWFVRGVLRTRARATPIAHDDPWLLQAAQAAHEHIVDMLSLSASGQQVAIKFPYRNGADEIEHVWGALQRVVENSFEVVIMTPLFVGPTPDAPVRVEAAQIEDWQVFMPDGSIRGGFTTQAQLAVCRREGFSIPKALLQQEPRFADRIEFPPVAINP